MEKKWVHTKVLAKIKNSEKYKLYDGIYNYEFNSGALLLMSLTGRIVYILNVSEYESIEFQNE